MNKEQNSPDFEKLEPALEAAVNALLAEPIPEDAVERVKARAKPLAADAVPPAPASRSRNRRWKAPRFFTAGLAVAVAILVMATAGILLLNYSGDQAFARMIEGVKTASSVHFTTATQMGKRPETKGAMYLKGNRVRMEQFSGAIVQVADFDRKQALVLNVPGKTAQKVELDADLVRTFVNPIDQLQRAKSDNAEPMGEEMLRGRHAILYRLHKVDLLFIKGDTEMLVWIDAESELPAKIVIRDADPKFPMEFRFDEFVWNEPLDAGLFSLAVPDGFQSGVVMETPKPTQPVKTPYRDNPNYLANGVLCRDRVPARIVWDPQGKTITALMREPESAPPQENELRRWDVATGKLQWSQKVGGAFDLAMTPDGKTFAVVVGWEVQLRDAASGKITQKWATDEHVSPLAFSPDGKTLAAGIAEWGKYGGKGGKEYGGVQLWNVEQAALVRSIPSDAKPTQSLKYSPDGKYVATAAESVRLWDTATGSLARVFPAVRAEFSPDGRTIACQMPALPADKDKTVGRIDLFNLQDGSLVKSFASKKGASASWVTCIAFSPNGRLLAAADRNGTVTLWDVTSGEVKETFADHQAGVLSVAFASDGATLATGSEDKTLRLRKLPPEVIRPALEKK